MNTKQNRANDDVTTIGINGKVYKYIFDQIIEAKLQPGERINSLKIASDLGISRSPIRWALECLVKEGFVQTIGERGYQVAPLAMSDCLHLCDSRKILEGGAAYMAANSITFGQIEILERNIDDSKKCLAEKRFDEYAKIDEKFHDTIFDAGNNRYMKAMLGTMLVKMNRYRHIISSCCQSTAEIDTSHALEKHMCIFQAIKNHFSSVAQNEMEEHISYTYRCLYDIGIIINQKRI